MYLYFEMVPKKNQMVNFLEASPKKQNKKKPTTKNWFKLRSSACLDVTSDLLLQSTSITNPKVLREA